MNVLLATFERFLSKFVNKRPLTTFGHSNFVAFAKAAGLAALPPVLVYCALVGCRTDVIILSC